MKANLVLLLVFVLVGANAQGNFRAAQFTMSIKGTSNLHEWESKVTDVRATGSMTTDANALQSIQSLQVEIPVKSIKSPTVKVNQERIRICLHAFNTKEQINLLFDVLEQKHK